MKLLFRPRLITMCVGLLLSIQASLIHAQATAPRSHQEAVAAPIPTRNIIEAVIDNHIDPPTRQQLVHEVIRGAAVAQESRVPTDLSERISRISDVDELYELLAEEYQRLGGTLDPMLVTSKGTIQRLNQIVAGGLQVVAAKEHRVNEQLAANRYVGIGVQVLLNSRSERLQFMKVFEGGSGEAAGLMNGDVVMSVDGKDTHRVPIDTVVDWLRGPEGSKVAVTVKSMNSPTTKEFEIVRAVIPLKTVKLVEGVDPEAALIRLDRVTASTAHELRKIIQQLSEQQQTVILDLRFHPQHTLHFLHLLADAMLDDGELGFLESRSGLQPLITEAGTIFGDRKPVLVYNPLQSRQIAWLASVLQDNGVSVYQDPFVGSTSHPDSSSAHELVQDSVTLNDRGHVIHIATARLLTNNKKLFDGSKPAGEIVSSNETSSTSWLADIWSPRTKIRPLAAPTALVREGDLGQLDIDQQTLVSPPVYNMAPRPDAMLVQQILLHEKRKAD